MDEQDDLRHIIEEGIRSDFWNEYLKPQLDKDIEEAKEFLTACEAEKVLEVQIRIKILRYLLEKPRRDYKDLNEKEE